MLLFFKQSQLKGIVKWIAPVLGRRGFVSNHSIVEMLAYIGHEVTSSLKRVGVIKDVWSSKCLHNCLASKS